MYVRSKVVKGRTYHQVVEGVRVGKEVRQRVVVALGLFADPAAALEAWEREVDALEGRRRRESRYIPGATFTAKQWDAVGRRREWYDGKIGVLNERINALAAALPALLRRP